LRIFIVKKKKERKKHQDQCPKAAWPSCKKLVKNANDGSTSLTGTPVQPSASAVSSGHIMTPWRWRQLPLLIYICIQIRYRKHCD